MDRNNFVGCSSFSQSRVALRKESVDRNNAGALPYDEEKESLSARRAWIEISYVMGHRLRAYGRSPQGERG